MTESTHEIEDRGDEFVEEQIDPEAHPAEDQGIVEPEVTKPEVTKPEPEARIPLARFKEINDRLREERQARQAVEARLRNLETPKPPPFDIAAAEKAYLSAVTEGDTAQASTLFAQIREHDRRGIAEQLSTQVQHELATARAQMALEAVAEAMIEKYPFLDSASAEANSVAIQEVVEWRDYFVVSKGQSPAQALKQAVARVAPTYLKAAGQAATQQAADQRVQAQRMINAKAMASSPPNTAIAGIGERAARAARTDVAKMTDAEFESLPAAEREKLRGDTLT